MTKYSDLPATPTDPAPRLRAYSTADMLALPTPTYLIEGWLPRGGMAVLHARGNTGKSLLAIDWGARIATGLDWEGQRVQTAPVVYCALEDNVGVRVAAWMEHNGRDLGDSAMWWLIDGVNLRSDQIIEELTALVLDVGAGLVVIDTVSRAMPAFKEVASEEMAFVTGAADRLRRSAGTTTLFLHHEPHHANRARGHSSLYDDADSVFGLEAVEPPGTIRLSCSKQRNGARPVPILLELVDVTDAPGSVTLGPARANTNLARLSDSARTLGQLLGQRQELRSGRYSELLEAADKYLGMPKSTFKSALNRLVDEGFLVRTGAGKDTRYTKSELLPAFGSEEVGT